MYGCENGFIYDVVSNVIFFFGIVCFELVDLVNNVLGDGVIVIYECC